MISYLAKEVAYWIDAHQGARPSQVRIPQSIMDELVEDGKHLGLVKDNRCLRDGTKILGIPVLADPTLTIGKIDP